MLDALATQLRALPVAGQDGATAADVSKAWEEIISRLSKTLAYIQASRQMVAMPCRLHSMIGAGQLSTAPEFLNIALTEAAKSQLGPRSPTFRRFVQARDSAARALQELKSFIDANGASWPENYVVSKSAYEAAMREEELADLTAEQIVQIGEDVLTQGAAARKWQSWHRHMALVMMAMQFMLQTRLEQIDAHPFLSCYYIQILLAPTLPDRRHNDEEEVMRQMQIRH